MMIRAHCVSQEKSWKRTVNHVEAADGGQNGIEPLPCGPRQRPSVSPLVITDLGMPYVDGPPKWLQPSIARSVDPPVLLLTGWGRRLLA